MDGGISMDERVVDYCASCQFKKVCKYSYAFKETIEKVKKLSFVDAIDIHCVYFSSTNSQINQGL